MRQKDRDRWEVLQQQLKSGVIQQFCGGYLPQPNQLGKKKKKKREQSKKERREATSK
jgi:hypothetical protein